MNTSISTLLASKGGALRTVPSTVTVAEAVQEMNRHKIGAILVMNEATLTGIFTERDVLTRVVAGNLDPKTTPITAVMTANVLTVAPTATVQQVMDIFAERHCRHLPVIEAGRLTGLISIGDVSRWVVLPYFAAAGTPRYNPLARGTIVGLTFSHSRFDIARAFMEGITLDMKDMVNSMARAGLRVTEARLLGGPTKSRVWNQIQADVYGVPVTTLKVTDATVLGAAILGGVGAGVFSSIEEAADAMVRLDERFEPIPENVQTYARLYDAYCRGYEGLERSGVFAALADLQK